MVGSCFLCFSLFAWTFLTAPILGGSTEFDDEEEYAESKEETMEQLKQFQAFLTKMLSGDMTLMDEFATAQLVSFLHPIPSSPSSPIPSHPFPSRVFVPPRRSKLRSARLSKPPRS